MCTPSNLTKHFSSFLSYRFSLLVKWDKCHIHLSRTSSKTPSLASNVPPDPSTRRLLKNTPHLPKQGFWLDWRRNEESHNNTHVFQCPRKQSKQAVSGGQAWSAGVMTWRLCTCQATFHQNTTPPQGHLLSKRPEKLLRSHISALETDWLYALRASLNIKHSQSSTGTSGGRSPCSEREHVSARCLTTGLAGHLEDSKRGQPPLFPNQEICSLLRRFHHWIPNSIF